MRIIHLSTVHTSSDVRILLKECCSLADAGFDVHYCVQSPHADTVGGVTLHSLGEPAVDKRVRHTGARLQRLLTRNIRAYRLAVSLKGDAYHVHDPELIPVALRLKRRGFQAVYDAHEDSPTHARTTTKQRPLESRVLGALWGNLEARAMAALDAFVCATPTIARRYPPERTVLVRNYPICSELCSTEGIPYAERGNLVAYIGSISAVRASKEMVEAMGLVPAGLKARLVLAGKFNSPELEANTRRLPGWQHVELLGFVPREEVVRLLGSARVGLVLCHPVQAYIASQPVKMFEYMAAGIPVVASDFPVWREILDGAGCGVLADPLDPKSIADAVRWLLEHPREAEAMGQRGREAVLARYNWQAEAAKLVALYHRLAAARGRGAAGRQEKPEMARVA